MRHAIPFLAALMIPAALAAQAPSIFEPPPRPWPQVMVLGTVHLNNPGRDAAKTTLDDVLAPKRQKEIEDVVAALARFNPTKIAVETEPSREAQLNARYEQYLAGSYELTRNETDQIAMRLARRLGHKKLYAIDHQMDLDFDAAMKYAAANGQQDQIAWFGSTIQRIEKYFAELYARGTIGEILAGQNDDEHAVDGIAMYQLMSRIGKDTSYVGADIAATWYTRNVRIYTNILRITLSPTDRVLVLIGGGHRPLLRQLFMQTPGIDFVPTLPYLPASK